MKRAVVIKMVGDESIGNAIESAIKVTLPHDEMEALRGELMYYRARDAKEGVHAYGRCKSWANEIAALPARYGYLDERQNVGWLKETLLVGWALLWMFVQDRKRRFITTHTPNGVDKL